MLRLPFIIEARCFVLGKTLSLSVVATSPVAPSARYQDSSNLWLANLRVRLFSVTVRAGNLWLDEQGLAFGDCGRHLQAAVASGGFVVAVGQGEWIRFPGQQGDPVLDRPA